eukprot:985905-Pleurochrysis_carterae.AAC.2
MNVNATESLTDCCSQLDLELAAAAAAGSASQLRFLVTDLAVRHLCVRLLPVSVRVRTSKESDLCMRSARVQSLLLTQPSVRGVRGCRVASVEVCGSASKGSISVPVKPCVTSGIGMQETYAIAYDHALRAKPECEGRARACAKGLACGLVVPRSLDDDRVDDDVGERDAERRCR